MFDTYEITNLMHIWFVSMGEKYKEKRGFWILESKWTWYVVQPK
jgi:hypothetical protein